MKKVISILLSMTLLVPASSMPVSAVDDNRNVTVSTEIAPAYIVTIPTNTQVYFNVEDTNFGAIELSKAQLEPGKCVAVTLLTDNLLENKSDTSKILPFTIYTNGQVFSQAEFTSAGERTDLSIHIDREDWNKAYAGEYEDTVTFRIEYINR